MYTARSDSVCASARMTRHRALERSALVAQRRRSRADDAVRRARGDSHARNDRRQPRACRSGRGTAGGDAGARRAIHAAPIARRSRAGVRRGVLHAVCSRRRSNPANCSPRSKFRRLPPRSGYAFQEISRRHGDFALAGVAAVVTLDETGRCTTARIALLSVGDRPVLAAGRAHRSSATSRRQTAIRAAADAAASGHRSAERHPRLEPLSPPSRDRADAPGARRRLSRAGATAMKIYDLSQPLNEQVLVLAVLPAVRGEVHQAQGRARRERAVHHDVEPHGHAPRRAAPLRDRRHDDRRDPGRVAVRPGRDRRSVRRDGRARDLHAEDDRGPRRGSQRAISCSCTPAGTSTRSSARSRTRRSTSIAIPARIRTWCRGCSRRRSTSGASTASRPITR